jgi:GTP 3',8-cyclase
MIECADAMRRKRFMNAMPELIDNFGRTVNYLRLSVTDRCDFRCVYCMAEEMEFLPRDKVLTLEELAQVAAAHRALGVTKLRVTGGEPLVRRDVIQLFNALGKLQFEDLSLTTNGSRLQQFARPLVDAGVDRVNISLDSLRAPRFRQLTRTGNLQDVLSGIDAAQQAGFKRIKINAVIMQNVNADEVGDLTRFALERNFDISFIEEMPLGNITSHQRQLEFISSSNLRDLLQRELTLLPSAETSGGPSRYWRVPGYDRSRIGFISPHSENFCGSCNRVRVTAEGRLLLCLGNEHSVDLRAVLRTHTPENQLSALMETIRQAMTIKPERHYFDLHNEPQIVRFMNATGG